MLRADELARRFEVSVETVRRDLRALARDGVLDRVYGGATVRDGDLALSGSHARAFFADYYADRAFLGSGGVHPAAGLTDYHPDEVDTRRVVIEQAERSYVLADSSKLGAIAVRKVCDLD